MTSSNLKLLYKWDVSKPEHETAPHEHIISKCYKNKNYYIDSNQRSISGREQKPYLPKAGSWTCPWGKTPLLQRNYCRNMGWFITEEMWIRLWNRNLPKGSWAKSVIWWKSYQRSDWGITVLFRLISPYSFFKVEHDSANTIRTGRGWEAEVWEAGCGRKMRSQAGTERPRQHRRGQGQRVVRNSGVVSDSAFQRTAA